MVELRCTSNIACRRFGAFETHTPKKKTHASQLTSNTVLLLGNKNGFVFQVIRPNEMDINIYFGSVSFCFIRNFDYGTKKQQYHTITMLQKCRSYSL